MSTVRRLNQEQLASSDDIESRILTIAARLFMEKGFAATTVRDIGEQAGIGQSSLYYYIQSKGQILTKLHETFIRHLTDELTIVTSSGQSPSDQLRAIVQILLSIVESHLAEVTVFLRENHALDAEAMNQIRAERDRIDDMIDDVLLQGMTTGEFRKDLNVPLTRLAILGMCNWSYQWFSPSGSQKMTQISSYFADLALAAVVS